MTPEVEILEGRVARIGALTVRRSLPTRGCRMVGAWCFVDHMGPQAITPDVSVDVGPHPHSGLQTVTWLLSGAFLHRDSLGSEQLIRPGELNLMTAGHGVAHSEENPGMTSGQLHGLQLWVAQPAGTREGEASFEHHHALPQWESTNVAATVLVGTHDSLESPARRDSDHGGMELRLHGGEAVLPVRRDFEYGLIVAEGVVEVEGRLVEPGQLAYLGLARDELTLRAHGRATAMLIGGIPFEERVFMWWNFVARSADEVSRMWQDWATGDERYGRVASSFARIETAAPVWLNPSL